MTAITLQIGTNGAVHTNIVDQELNFFIGPSTTNTLISESDYDLRLEEVKILTEPDGARYADWLIAIEKALGVVIGKIDFHVNAGGKHGLICPNLHIDLSTSETADGELLLNYFTPQTTLIIIRTLIKLLDAHWVDVWYTGSFGNHQINCERNADAIWFKGHGKQEVLK